MKLSDLEETSSCNVATEILGRVGDKWSILAVYNLTGGTLRFNELRRRISNITQKMLTRTLRKLERDGFVFREVKHESPPSVYYSLTKLGREFEETAVGLARWAETHSEEILKARRNYDNNEENK